MEAAAAAHTSSSSSTITTSSSEHFLITQPGGRRKPMIISSVHDHGYRYDLLHSVRKPALYNKPWRKQPVAPLPPNTTRVYKVKPVEFKDVVQKLTGAPEFQPTRLQTVAPAPLDLNLGGVVRVAPDDTQLSASPPAEVKSNNGIGFALSPSSSAWCSFLLLSPEAGAGSTLLL